MGMKTLILSLILLVSSACFANTEHDSHADAVSPASAASAVVVHPAEHEEHETHLSPQEELLIGVLMCFICLFILEGEHGTSHKKKKRH